MKKILALVFVLIFLLPIALAGVTSPLPSNIELTKGESSRFKFQIQAVNSEEDMVCTYAFAEQPPFLVEFDEPETTVPAGSRSNVYGTVTPTEATGYGTTKSEFCVSCRPVTAPAGASVQVDTCGLDLTVTLVNQRTRDNLYVPDKESPGLGTAWTTILVIIGLILIALVVFWLLKKKKEYKSSPATVKDLPVKAAPKIKNKVAKAKKPVAKRKNIKKRK